MVTSHNDNPVVVGIDGSDAALHAALWAIEEAAARDVPLRLVSCIDLMGSDAIGDDEWRMNREFAQTSLRAVRAAIDATGQSTLTPDTLSSRVPAGRTSWKG